jgi:biotin transport system substrate-specific component
MSNYATSVLRPAFPGARVLADTLPGHRVRDLLLILGGAGLTALGAQVSIHVPGSPVPVTAQTLAVVLAGSSLGAWRGASSQLLYLLLGLVLPIYAPPGPTSGTAVLFGDSGGYIFGFVIAAGLIGWAAEHGADRRLLLAPLTFALGQLAIFGIGVPWLKVAANIPWGTAIHEGFTIFILGGVIKAILAAIAMPSAWRIQRRVSHGR